jgi:hypothetical protein
MHLLGLAFVNVNLEFVPIVLVLLFLLASSNVVQIQHKINAHHSLTALVCCSYNYDISASFSIWMSIC